MDGVPRGQPASVRSDQLKEQLAPVLTACLLLIGCCRGKPISWRLLIGCPARAAFNVSLDSQQVLTSLSLGRNGDFPDHPMLIRKKIARGTDNFAVQPAMGDAGAIKAIEQGARIIIEENNSRAWDIVGMGEMGIGNTTSATAIISAVSGLSPARLTGRGTGVDNSGLERKIEVIEKSLALHQPDPTNAIDLLAKIGGYELGGICGAVLAAASRKCCVVLDGVISTAAGLLAYLICPAIGDYLIAGHKSVEISQKTALKIMGLEPVIDLDMRLGEGTGAAIAINLVELSCRMMREMASFDDAGVSTAVTQ